MSIQIKRVYAEPEKSDGTRILVDRLWPRGLSKEKAHVDLWLKEAAPSTDLRKWFAHDPKKRPEFKSRYIDELKSHAAELALLKEKSARGAVTLLFGARDELHNEAVVLKNVLERN